VAGFWERIRKGGGREKGKGAGRREKGVKAKRSGGNKKGAKGGGRKRERKEEKGREREEFCVVVIFPQEKPCSPCDRSDRRHDYSLHCWPRRV